MKIHTVMSSDVVVLEQDQNIRNAAELMRSRDIGSIPVSASEKLVGMITDRDIVLRAVAEGLSQETPLSQVMSQGVKYCYAEDEVDDVARNMAELGVRRLPVIDADKKLVGIVSLSNIAQAGDSQATENLLEGTAQPH